MRAPRVARQGRVPARSSPSTRRPTRTASGSSAAAGRSPTSPAACRGARTSTASSPIGRCSSPTATATTRGSTPGRSSSPGSPKDTPDPDDGRIARDPDGTPIGTLHEGAADLVERLVPRDHAGGLPHGPARGPALPPRPRDHGLAGRVGRRPATRPRTSRSPSRGELTARVIGALWWDRSRGLEQIDDIVERRADGRVGRYAAHERQAHARRDHREPDGGDAPAVLRVRRARRPTTRGLDFIDAETLTAGRRRSSTRSGSRPTSTRSATGRCAMRSTRSRPRGATNGWSDTRPHLAHLQVVHPDDIPRFAPARRARQRPAAVGRARGADDRAHAAGPRAGRSAPASTRGARCGGTARRS